MKIIRGTREAYKLIKTHTVDFTDENQYKGKTWSEKIGKDKRDALSAGVC